MMILFGNSYIFLMIGQTSDDFVRKFILFCRMIQNYCEIAGINLRTFYGSLLGNQVDGLPSARHTETVGRPHGGFGPAPIDATGPRKRKIRGQSDYVMPDRFNQVFNYICMVVFLEFQIQVLTK